MAPYSAHHLLPSSLLNLKSPANKIERVARNGERQANAKTLLVFGVLVAFFVQVFVTIRMFAWFVFIYSDQR